mgnify:CR=1 FL=1
MNPTESGASVRAAARTLDIIESFAAAGGPLSLSELAAAIGAPMSSCHAIVRTLQARGYLYALERKRRLHPTRRLYDVAIAIARHDPLLERLRPALAALRDCTGETVVLARREGDEVVYLDVLESPQTIRYATRPGEKKPIHSSSLGKALLSVDDRAAFDAFLRRSPLRPITPNTITDGDVLWRQLQEGRRAGYIASRSENVIDVTAVAMLLEIGGETLALALAGPVGRYQARFQENLAALRATVAELRQAGLAA